VALGITKMVGLRQHRIERRLKTLLFLANRERLVHLLLDLAEQFGSHTDEGTALKSSQRSSFPSVEPDTKFDYSLGIEPDPKSAFLLAARVGLDPLGAGEFSDQS